MNPVVLTALLVFATAQLAFEIFGSFAGLPFAIVFRRGPLDEQLFIAPVVAGLAGVPLTLVCVHWLFIGALGTVPWWAWFYWECKPMWDVVQAIRVRRAQLNDKFLPAGAALADLKGECLQAACLIVIPAIALAGNFTT